MPHAPVITLLTDFGTADGYVGEMKGVLVTGAPAASIIDISHDLPPFDVEYARLTFARYWRRYPAGTVHVVVVDPGVGSTRAAIAVESDGRYLVGPDNGVLSPALFALDARVVSLSVVASASPTFHGRDVFAPAAAALAQGELLDSLGEPFREPVRLRTRQPVRRPDGTIDGEVLTLDRFGNAITNLVARDIDHVVVQSGDVPRQLRLVRTYADASVGEAVALVGSSGFVEIAVRERNAGTHLQLGRGDRVSVRQHSR